MKIEIDDHQLAELQKRVAAGEFASIEEAVGEALELMLLEFDDMAWAKPLVDDALAELMRGEGIPAADVIEEMRAHLAKSRA